MARADYRASDVPPSKRNKRWDALVTQAATNHIEQLVKKDEAYEAMSFAEAAVEAFPILRKATDFMALRSKVVIAGAEKCFERACGRSGCETLDDDWGGSRCAKPLLAAVEQRSDHHEARNQGRQPRLQQREAEVLRRAVLQVCGDRPAPMKLECASEELQNSTLWAMRMKVESPFATSAREVAARWCWTAFTKSSPEQVTAEDPYGILEQAAAPCSRNAARTSGSVFARPLDEHTHATAAAAARADADADCRAIGIEQQAIVVKLGAAAPRRGRACHRADASVVDAALGLDVLDVAVAAIGIGRRADLVEEHQVREGSAP